jgi:hypothetical protein
MAVDVFDIQEPSKITSPVENLPLRFAICFGSYGNNYKDNWG